MNHSHVLYDSDPHFKIDPISRNILNESSKKVKLIQHDHNSERFTFEAPRYIEGHDLSTCNKVEIHYLNIESNTKIPRAGVYTVDDLQIKSDDDNAVVCSWMVGNNATLSVGQLQFLIRFSCVNDDTGELEYVWNTAVYSGITISSGIYNNDSASDNPTPPYNLVTTINGRTVRFFIGTQAEYDAIDGNDANTIYYITDDNTLGDIDADINEAINDLTNKLLMGEITVKKAENANSVSTATDATRILTPILKTSIIAEAEKLSVGVYHYRLGGTDYTGNDLPNDYARYCNATVFVREATANYKSIVIVIEGGKDSSRYYRSCSNSTWGDWVKIIDSNNIANQTVEKAKYLENDGHRFGRVKLWSNPVFLMYSPGCTGWMQESFSTISLPSDLVCKNLIVNIAELKRESIGGATFYSHAYGFHTPVFKIFAEGQDGAYTYMNGAHFTFAIDGSTLYFKVSGGDYVIESVYEELI